MAPSSQKRELEYDYGDDDDDAGQVYVPLKKRREEQLKRLAVGSRGASPATSGRENGKDSNRESTGELDPEEAEERERARKRLERTLLSEAQDVKAKKAAEGAHITPIYKLC